MSTGAAQSDERTALEAPPDGAGRGDLDGLLTFLQWMRTQTTGEGRAHRPWRTSSPCGSWPTPACTLPRRPRSTGIGVGDLADRVTRSGSTDIYARRLAVGLPGHQRWRAEEPDWWRRTWIRNPRGPSHTARTRQADAGATTVPRFPLRPELTAAIEPPHNLHGQDADLVPPGCAISPPKAEHPSTANKWAAARRLRPNTRLPAAGGAPRRDRPPLRRPHLIFVCGRGLPRRAQPARPPRQIVEPLNWDSTSTRLGGRPSGFSRLQC